MRVFIQPSWRDAASDHSEWSGESPDDRKRRSHMIGDKANISAYSDEALEARKPKKSPIPLKQRILPQAARVEKLTAQMIELCAEYKAGLHTQEEYSLLLSVVAAKRARVEELLAKAISVKAPFEREEEEIPNVSEVSPREILSKNKRSTLKRKEPKGACVKAHPKTENVKHDRKSLSKVVDWINRNSFIYFIGCSTIALTAAKIIF